MLFFQKLKRQTKKVLEAYQLPSNFVLQSGQSSFEVAFKSRIKKIRINSPMIFEVILTQRMDLNARGPPLTSISLKATKVWIL